MVNLAPYLDTREHLNVRIYRLIIILGRLTVADFNDVVWSLRVPTHLLPPPTVAGRERACHLVAYILSEKDGGAILLSLVHVLVEELGISMENLERCYQDVQLSEKLVRYLSSEPTVGATFRNVTQLY